MLDDKDEFETVRDQARQEINEVLSWHRRKVLRRWTLGASILALVFVLGVFGC
jgi:hypothetical protein